MTVRKRYGAVKCCRFEKKLAYEPGAIPKQLLVYLGRTTSSIPAVVKYLVDGDNENAMC